MAYCRFGSDSDVYVYAGLDDRFHCCACRLAPLERVNVKTGAVEGNFSIHRDQSFDTIAEVIRHLHEHEAAGHTVPAHTYSRLIEEIVGDDDMVPRSEHAVD